MTTSLVITVSVPDDVAPTRHDQLTETLRRDLRGVKRISAHRLESTVDGDGTKSAALQEIGTLAVSGVLTAGGLAAIAGVVREFVKRTTAGSVTVQRGDNSVTVSGVSHKDAKAVLADLERLLDDEIEES